VDKDREGGESEKKKLGRSKDGKKWRCARRGILMKRGKKRG
jgi:hypothetical protein